ncbi:MAG: HTH domain-containing protein [Candidatus Synoicihabitans palmerolidicus]|nr:HTH domain-containing protein [Candidatus Synoicihabitans palmerolidicus]
MATNTSATGFRSRFSVERMMRIHDRLCDGSSLNCTRFAAELEVSRKTIQRDIDNMRDRLGLPIEYDRVSHSYLYTWPVEAFPTVQMSEGDAVALFVAERALEPLRGTPLYDRLQSTFDRLTASLKGTVEFTPADHDAVSFGQFGEGRTNAKAFDSLQKAHDQQREVTFTYKKPGGMPPETRRVRPYHPHPSGAFVVSGGLRFGSRGYSHLCPAPDEQCEGLESEIRAANRFHPKNLFRLGVGRRERTGRLPNPHTLLAHRGRTHHRARLA